MKQKTPDSGLLPILDYILNRASLREIDALQAAVERRRKDLESRTGIISLDPQKAAHRMSETIQTSINRSMDGVRETFRRFAADTIRKEAPELTEEQLNELVDSWIPEHMAVDASGTVHSSSSGPVPASANSGDIPIGKRQYTGLARKGLINGIPPDALYAMVCQFVTYSTGAMSIDEEASLRDELGDWTTLYWKKFPREVQDSIRDFLQGALNGEEFDACLSALLG